MDKSKGNNERQSGQVKNTNGVSIAVNKVFDFSVEDLLQRKPIKLDDHSISAQLKGKVILITGAAGSIGSEIVRQVVGFRPKKVILLDQAETPMYQLNLEMVRMAAGIELRSVISDIRNLPSLKAIFETERPQVVYHAAAYKHVQLMEENPVQAVLANILGTKNVADLSNAYNVESFVLISTDKAVNPANVLGASKRIAELYIHALHAKNKQKKGAGIKFITTRFGNVLGSNGSVVPLFTEQINQGGPVTITHPEITRYFMTIPEACQLVLEAGAMAKGGETYIFDMGKPVKITDLAEKMIRLAGLQPGIDVKIEVVGLRPGEKLYEELLSTTSKTLPTHNKDIMIVQEEVIDFIAIENNIDALLVLAETFNDSAVVARMKELLPEFINENKGEGI